MFDLKTEQKIFDVGGVKVGGITGKDPTVLVGTIFYKRQNLVEDEFRGIFDKNEAEKLILRQEELSDITGVPSILDVEGSTIESMNNYIEFTADITKIPLMIGGPTPEVREAGLKIAKELGIIDRVIYNSLMPGCSIEEIQTIKKYGVDCTVLLAYNVTDFTPEGRLKALKELLTETNKQGIGKPLLDTFVMDVPSLGVAFNTFKEAPESVAKIDASKRQSETHFRINFHCVLFQ